jgi:hypothetical protein
MRARQSRESYWKSRTWIFADDGEPELLTLIEFMAVLSDRWSIPASREELVTLANLGAFTPQYLVYTCRIATGDSRVVDLMLPVYEAKWVPAFIGFWLTEFSLHVPVAITTVEQLREEWGPKLRQAREALGLTRGDTSIHTAMVGTYKLATGKSWAETARAFYPEVPPETQQLRSAASRHRRKARDRTKMHILGLLPDQLQPALRRGVGRLSQRIEREAERLREALRQGGFPSTEDPDLLMNISYH